MLTLLNVFFQRPQRAFTKDDLKVLKMLLAARAPVTNPQHPDAAPEAPLHVASYYALGRDVVTMLLEATRCCSTAAATTRSAWRPTRAAGWSCRHCCGPGLTSRQ